MLPNGTFQATLSKSNAQVLQSPQVRAADNAKAVLKIGQKVPTASGSFQPGIGGVGINPLVNTQFQFIDVGVNVEMTPTIHGTEEVSLHVDMDISTVDSHVNLGGIDQPVIGQRKATFDVRLREGEVNVLGGLMQTQDSLSNAGTPGLASIPILGRLFSRETKERTTNELIFVLIPHIVRAPEITETNMRGVASGSDTVVKLNYRRREVPVPAAVVAAPPAAVPAPPAPVATAPADTPPAPPPPGVPAAPPATAPPAQLGRTPAAVTFSPPRAEGQLGSAITVSMMVENASDLFSAPFKINFDPKIVRLNDVIAGNFLTSDGKQILPISKNILNDTGEATVALTRAPGAGGVSGGGALVTFVFQAVAKGTSNVTFADFTLRDSKLQQIPSAMPQLTVTVR